jgi:tRNA(Ile)-lysidine synthase
MTQDLSLVIEQIAVDYPDNALWIAYSGGVDSHVLLHLLASSDRFNRLQLHAIHIDHGLQADSAKWADHCQGIATALNIDFHCVRVGVNHIAELGVEAAAREARYQAIDAHVPANALVLTAQHQDDQAETLLLQLLRGAGIKGLASMAAASVWQNKRLVRPLLAISQTAILAYAQQHQLDWIDDPSNADTQLNRNYIRQTVWPLIERRWPNAAKAMRRSAGHCAEASRLLSELAEIDLTELGADIEHAQLPISGLLNLSPSRARNLIRHLLAAHDFAMPSTVILRRILDEVCLADDDKMPLVTWSKCEVRRYRDVLYFLSPRRAQVTDAEHVFSAPDDAVLADGRHVSWLEVDQMGVSEALFSQGVRLAFRQGGEGICLAGHQHHKSLKQLYQEWAIPPWERGNIPLLFCNDELLVVVGYGFHQDCVLPAGEKGYIPMIKAR